MELMIEYSTAILSAIADFLGTEPLIYLFTIFCLMGIVKVFRSLAP